MVFELWLFGLGDVIGILYLFFLIFKILFVRFFFVLGFSIMIGFFMFFLDCNVGLFGYIWFKEDIVVVLEGYC